jgi:hypothetical protein
MMITSFPHHLLFQYLRDLLNNFVQLVRFQMVIVYRASHCLTKDAEERSPQFRIERPKQ